jgi:hypothetical protein
VAEGGLADAAGQSQLEGGGVLGRIVGLDLGVATDHTAVILDQTGAELGRRRVRPTRASLEALRALALAGTEAGVTVEVVIEPTGRPGCRWRCSLPPLGMSSTG